MTVNGGKVRMPVPRYERELNLDGVPTSARSLMRDSYPGGGTGIELDFSGWTVPYITADAEAGIPHPQGNTSATRPFD